MSRRTNAGNMSRRGLGKLSILASLTPVVGCSTGTEELLIGFLDDVTSEISEISYPEGFFAFVVKLDISAENGVGEGSRIVAFQSACAHQGCLIDEVDVSNGHFGPCMCHRSLFDLTKCGIQVSGRASTRLTQIELVVRGEEIWAVGLFGVAFGTIFSVGQGVVRGKESL